MRYRTFVSGLLLALAACDNPLSIRNDNTPDRERVFNNPRDLEVFVSGLFAILNQATIGGSNDGMQTQFYVMAMENNSNLANFAMSPRGAMPRSPIDNTPGSAGTAGIYHDWFRLHRAARQSTLALEALGNLSLGSAAADNRARAFAWLVHGIATGYLSMSYDSAGIVTIADNSTAGGGGTVALSPYQAVNTAALASIDSAITIANAGGITIPVVANFWINDVALTTAQFVQIARSYKALIRASVARTPAERAAVNWAEVIADANAGVTTDLAPKMDPTNGWDVSWVVQAFATGSANWHQMSTFWMGMADSSGQYDTWLATPNANKANFTVVSKDKRIPTGATRADQQSTTINPGTASAGQAFANTPYFRNRPTGEDQAAAPLQGSQYDFWRSRQFRQANRIGPYPIMTVSQVRLLAAEGYFRTGVYDQMINRVNVSRRAKGVLDSIPNTIADTATAVPGGVACVPRVPNIATNYLSSKCGNVWDALKWEYRMETAYTGYGNWYFASRGWGDLPEGTATHVPVPYQEMDSRAQPYYGLGGVGGASGAAGRGNYGLFAGGVY